MLLKLFSLFPKKQKINGDYYQVCEISKNGRRFILWGKTGVFSLFITKINKQKIVKTIVIPPGIYNTNNFLMEKNPEIKNLSALDIYMICNQWGYLIDKII